jgi:hypothetical protein
LKAVTAVHCHLDIHGINGILRQVIKMFDEAEIPDSAKYVWGISETISEITHTTLSRGIRLQTLKIMTCSLI